MTRTSAQNEAERREQLKGLLDRERMLTLERIRSLRSAQAQDAAPPPGDELDEAHSTAEVETHAGLIERAESRLNAIDDALTRVRLNRYGLCDKCGNEIPHRRLRALPLAEYCINCERKRPDATASGEGSIDSASSKRWSVPKEMDESLETQDALVEPEERLSVRDGQPMGVELGEFEQLPPVATAGRRGRIKPTKPAGKD